MFSDNYEDKKLIEEEQHPVVEQACGLITERSFVAWKDTVGDWLIKAMTLYSARAVHLWRKAPSQKIGLWWMVHSNLPSGLGRNEESKWNSYNPAKSCYLPGSKVW